MTFQNRPTLNTITATVGQKYLKTWLWSGITGGWKELNMMVLNGGSSRPSRKSQDGAATHSAVTLGLERLAD